MDAAPTSELPGERLRSLQGLGFRFQPIKFNVRIWLSHVIESNKASHQKSWNTTVMAPLPAELAGPVDCLMIDNFDSFSWNLYQQLCLLGAQVVVVRNDVLEPAHFPQLQIKNLIISPGPGHPKTDSGISREAMLYFAGKIPVLGVCMGLECLVDMYGGEIVYAGEIMHGKTSRIRHDGRGCFKGIEQDFSSIRYHSLSTDIKTLPEELAITAATKESGVVMGVRHRKYTVEAVQYHPESILSDGGDALVRNFLQLKGGTWAENPGYQVDDGSLPPFPITSPNGVCNAKRLPTMLEKIHQQRLKDVEIAKSTPGTTPADLAALLSLHVSPPQIPLLPRLRQDPDRPALMAEIKRASPSKGDIAPTANAAQQALTYALAGASVISVLTEPTWFKGSLLDMRLARQAIDYLPNRPAILRKDFIVDEYQIHEARLHGADTVLLIVAILPVPRLTSLYACAKELGMEPLVEVNNAGEMQAALDLGARVIGVNNRNLHDFEVDMGTTTRLAEMVKERDVVLCTLSGIKTDDDVRGYAQQGVSAVLVGESLMRAEDPAAFIRYLLGLPAPVCEAEPPSPLVKICGIRTPEDALAAADAGADLLGLVFAPHSKRRVSLAQAAHISAAVHAHRAAPDPDPPATADADAPWFATHARRLARALARTRPLVVGVFQQQSLPEVLRAVAAARLDLVQLHGAEPPQWAQHVPVPVVRAFHVGAGGAGLADVARPGAHAFVLLDSARDARPGEEALSGGSGRVLDWEAVRAAVERGEGPALAGAAAASAPAQRLPVILAGGLTPENVKEVVAKARPWAVDVSGGVESADGTSKDVDKIKAFIEAVKGA